MNILFDNNGKPHIPQHIKKCVAEFGESYKNNVYEVIRDTEDGINEKIFYKNVSKLMANFKMTRGGPFKGVKYYNGSLIDPNGIVVSCWKIANEQIIQIRNYLDDKNRGKRKRTLIELSESDRKLVVSQLWIVYKKLLPICMGSSTLGLVAASKILFAVLPEIAQPIDNVQWRKVFRTIDYSDVISEMAAEIVSWERQVGVKLDSCDPLPHTTLPAVYNVMAMKARPTNEKKSQ